MSNKQQKSIIIYLDYVYDIGGIESWLYYLCQNLCHYYNITFLFDIGSMEQLKRLNKYVDVEHRDRDKIYICDVLLIASNWSGSPKNIKYNKCISTVHSDYKYFNEQLKYNLSVIKNADEVVCVSKNAADSIKELFGIQGKIISNILGKKQKTNKILHLVSFTRLSEEKGYSRICALVKMLKENKIKFDWKIFSDIESKSFEKLNCPEVIFMEPTLDVYDYIVDADYLVQLSDSEAFCYSVHEALQYGTPVIVTNIEVFKDVVIDGYNGYKIELDMSNVDSKFLNKIVNNIPKDFEYDERTEEIKEQWFEVLGEPLMIYKYDKDYCSSTVKLEVLEDYYDKELQEEMKVGDIITVNKLRAYELTTINNNAHRKLCKVV